MLPAAPFLRDEPLDRETAWFLRAEGVVLAPEPRPRGRLRRALSALLRA